MTLVGITGEGAAAVAADVEDADGEALPGEATDLASSTADVLVALGEDALVALVQAGASRPVLPVGGVRGFGATPRTHLDAALSDLLDGSFETTGVRLLDVSVNGASYRALADVIAVTGEPAKISEYSVHAMIEGESRTVGTVRADGVVVATPRGSHGYAKDARGPILAPDADTVSVVPIAPFSIDRSHWGLTLPVRLTVERDESDVALVVDGTNYGTLDTHASVELTWGETIPLVRTSASQLLFE